MSEMSEVRAREILNSQPWQWRERLIKFLIPRLSGDEAHREQSLEMVMASLHEAHHDGIRDCALLIKQLADHTSGDRQFVLRTAEKALNELLRRNMQS
jgi:hypothetical protein